MVWCSGGWGGFRLSGVNAQKCVERASVRRKKGEFWMAGLRGYGYVAVLENRSLFALTNTRARNSHTRTQPALGW